MAHITEEDLHVYTGDDESWTINITDKSGNTVNVSGWSFTGEIRDDELPDGNLVETFDTSITSKSSGTIEISLSATKTRNLEDESRLVYDVESQDTLSETDTILRGKIDLTHDVTE